MARAAQSHLAVLAVLSVRPMTGYAVREAIRDQLGHFWSESFGQIYPALTKLTAEGYIERSPSERANSSVFRLTPAGRRRLTDLLRTPIEASPPRSGLMLRLFFGHTLGAEAATALIAEARDAAQRQVELFAGLRDLAADETARGVDLDHWPWWLITVSAGEHTARATIAWAEESISALALMHGTGEDHG